MTQGYIWAFAIIIVLDSYINTMGHTLLLSRECSRLDCLECLQCLQCAVITLITFRILITSLLPQHTHPHRKCFFYLSPYWNTVSHSYPQVPLLCIQPSSISNKHKTKSFCIQDLSTLGFHYLWGSWNQSSMDPKGWLYPLNVSNWISLV